MKKKILSTGRCFLYVALLILVYLIHLSPVTAQTDITGLVLQDEWSSTPSLMLSGPGGLTEGTDRFAQTFDESSSLAFLQGSTDLGKTAFSINLAGLLFFGPTFRFEFRVGSSTMLDAHLRWAYAGLLFQGLVTDFWAEDCRVLPYSLGVGTGFKVLLGNPSSRHRFYVGSVIEYNFGGSTSDYGKEERNHALILGGDIGMRWRSGTGFLFSLGIQPAAAFVFVDGYYYEEDPDDWHDYGFSVRATPILELSIGWEFGK